MMLLTIAANTVESGDIDKYLFENPWPLGLLLLCCGLVIGGLAFRDGNTRNLPVAAIFFVLGVVAIVLGLAVTTSGEHARRVAQAFITAAETNDLTGADRLLADEMTYGLADMANLPIGGKDEMMQALADLNARITLDENRTTDLDIGTISGEEGHVQVSFWTEATASGSGGGQMPIVARSSWILVVRHDEDGEWRVHRIIWVSLNGNVPTTRF